MSINEEDDRYSSTDFDDPSRGGDVEKFSTNVPGMRGEKFNKMKDLLEILGVEFRKC
jgi:hypothetical protein